MSSTTPTWSWCFFQAEDGIRDLTVTGVQTCALPICIGEAQRGVAAAQQLVGLFVEPGVVAKLEGHFARGRQRVEKVAQLRRVLAREWRELKEHGTELRPENLRDVGEGRDVAPGAGPPLLVRNPLPGL